MSLPTPVDAKAPDIRSVFSASDFPDYVAKAGVSRTVYTRTSVRPDGSVQECVAEGTSGDPKLDVFTCAIIVKRAKFRPATWMDGSPVFGVIRIPVRWVVNGGPQSYEDAMTTSIPDLELTVSKLPAGTHGIAGANVEVAADASGHPLACAEYPPSGRIEAEHHYPELIPIACEQVMKNLTITPATDDSGKTVGSVQNVVVHFLTPEKSKVTDVAQNPAAISHPKGNGARLMSVDDYPAVAVKMRWEGSVIADLTVNEKGHVSNCSIVKSSGHDVLDSATCSLLTRRAIFYPAKDRTGKPVEDVVRTPPIEWRLR